MRTYRIRFSRSLRPVPSGRTSFGPQGANPFAGLIPLIARLVNPVLTLKSLRSLPTVFLQNAPASVAGRRNAVTARAEKFRPCEVAQALRLLPDFRLDVPVLRVQTGKMLRARVNGCRRLSLFQQPSKLLRREPGLLDDGVEGPFGNRLAEMDRHRERSAVGGAIHREVAALLPPSRKARLFENPHDLAGAKRRKLFRRAMASHERRWSGQGHFRPESVRGAPEGLPGATGSPRGRSPWPLQLSPRRTRIPRAMAPEPCSRPQARGPNQFGRNTSSPLSSWPDYAISSLAEKSDNFHVANALQLLANFRLDISVLRVQTGQRIGVALLRRSA